MGQAGDASANSVSERIEFERRILGPIPLQRQAFPKLPAIVEVEDQQFAEQVRPFVAGNPGQEFIDSRASPGLPCRLELVANSIGPQAA